MSIMLYGVGIFIYQTMDNMDGKQARKTGSSSPLGMVVDHGFDAVNTVLQGLALSKIFMMDPTSTGLFTSMLVFAFFIATYES